LPWINPQTGSDIFRGPFQLPQFLHHLRPRLAQGQAAILTQQSPRFLMQHFHA
jgi:hypothetical protein